ncbi:MAG: phosphate signaling complex protein PhoU [Promethearchaeota archaeon]
MAKVMHEEIINLKKEFIEMANLALSMLNDAIKALINKDIELAKTVDERKRSIRDYDVDMEEKVLKLIALYQPMAIDLRRLATILKNITYLYRLGRYGKDIAAVVKYFVDLPPLSESLGIKHIWEHVKPMIEDAIEAFDVENISKLKDFEERDNEVDQLRWSIFRESVSYMMEYPKYITACAYILMIARYLERCGDHACKMAEKIHYMVTGDHIEIS